VLGYVLVYQQIENYWLSPKISARTMELNAGLAFGSALAGGALFGPMGAFMALPVAALIYSFIKNYRHGHEVVYRSAYADDSSPPASRTEVEAEGRRVEAELGLALGSGGARGLAHIGAIQVLEEHEVSIDVVAGSSIGALVGALYCSGNDGEALYGIASDTTLLKIIPLFDPSLRHGFLGGTKLERLIKTFVVVAVRIAGSRCRHRQ
jgi:hypothetical protein